MSKGPDIVRLTALDGATIEFDASEVIGSGAMKDVYFSPDKSYVVGFFRKEQDRNSSERLEKIVDVYAKQLFEKEGGENLKKLFCYFSIFSGFHILYSFFSHLREEKTEAHICF